MLARALNQCGLELGPPNELLPPNQSNEEGYWENQQVVQLNEEVLSRSGYGWDYPPVPGTDWLDRDGLGALQTRGQELIAYLGKREPWGWKDPRGALTLPFWKSIIPDLTVIVCLRNPSEVVRSLQVRNDISRALGLHLWWRYYESIETSTSPGERIVTRYESYFSNPVGELTRVLNRINFEIEPCKLEQAAAIVSPRRRHHMATDLDELTNDLPTPHLEKYWLLCREADDRDTQAQATSGSSRCKPAVYQTCTDITADVRANFGSPISGSPLARTVPAQIAADELARELARAREHSTNLEDAIVHLKIHHANVYTELSTQLEEHRSQSAQLFAELDGLRQHCRNLEAERDNARQHNANLEDALYHLRLHNENLEAALRDLRVHSGNLEDAVKHLSAHTIDLERAIAGS
jgi:hypothetical protein